MPAVERKDGQQVEEKEEKVERGGQAEEYRELGLSRLLGRDDLAAEAAHSHDAHRAVELTLAAAHESLRDELVDTHGHRHERHRRASGEIPHLGGDGRPWLRDVLDLGSYAEEARRLSRAGGFARFVIDRAGDVDGAHGDIDGRAVGTLDGEHSLGRALLANLLGKCIPGGRCTAVVLRDEVTGLQPGHGRRGLTRGAGARSVGLTRGRIDGRHAGHDRGHGQARLRHANAHEHGGEEEEGEQEIHHRSAEHDDHALMDRQLVEDAILVAWRDLLERLAPRILDEEREATGRHGACGARGCVLRRRQHADHADVSADRDGLDAVRRLALALGPHGRAEADHVFGHLDAELLGRDEVADLMQGDRGEDEQEERDNAHDFPHHRSLPSINSVAADRAQVSASRTSCTVRGFPTAP